MANTEYRTTASELTSIADAIRTKGGTSSSLVYPNGFVNAIGNIQTGGVLQTKTVTPSTSTQTVAPDSGYDGLSSVIVGAMPSGSARVQNTTISVDPVISISTGGVVTATVSASQAVTPTVSAGYVSAGTAGTVTVSGSDTLQLTTRAAQTITPTTTDQTIASGQYLMGAQTILGDANLIPENIAKDVTIFGVTGTHEGGGGMPYDVVLHCTNSNGFTNNDSDYAWEVGDIVTVLHKATSGQQVTGIAYALITAYDDEEDIYSYDYSVLPLIRCGTTDYGGTDEYSSLSLQFYANNKSLYVHAMNEDPQLAPMYTYTTT